MENATDTRQSQRRHAMTTADLLLPDRFPECPRCFELNPSGATVCATCCAPLVAKWAKSTSA